MPVVSSEQASIIARQHRNIELNAEPLLEPLHDPKTLDVVVNSDGAVWANRLGSGWDITEQISVHDTRLLLQGIATVREKILDDAHPILETIFPLTGDRIQGIVEPIVTAPVIALRTRPKRLYSLSDLFESGVLTDKKDPLNKSIRHDDFVDEVQQLSNHREVLTHACRERKNILIVGPTGSGKTTFANGLIGEWETLTPDDRVVIIEDTPELQCTLKNHVQLLASRNVSQADLLVASLRLIPHRIVVGEIREEEAARVLLSAWNTGHSGGLCTIHANDAISGLFRIESLLGTHSLAIREQVAAAINLVVFIDTERSITPGRKVREIVAIKGVNPATNRYEYEVI